MQEHVLAVQAGVLVDRRLRLSGLSGLSGLSTSAGSVAGPVSLINSLHPADWFDGSVSRYVSRLSMDFIQQ